MIHRYDETARTQALAGLPIMKAAAFAAAVTTRQTINYEHCASALGLASPSRYREITAQLWELILSDELDNTGWDALLEEVMDMFAPETSDQWLRVALVEDAVSSLAYAIRFVLTHSAQEAAWAGRRAYEITDQITIAKLDFLPEDLLSEDTILSDVIVQRELGRQSRDIELLGSDSNYTSIKALRDLAHSETVLTNEELSQLDAWQRLRPTKSG
ncbi:DUF416 family protein [Rhizobium sp. TH2]|uniref:DUF416 family protein n=1 Tax=Rhizobium sp. TH2 TaxID=2775403 RepID=UPI002156FFAE|nr:DUF416 family protein [Rhizobium sp. TH2]UVC11311.1 DUF416 family protein [Rhizobium sp. TH2]